MAHSARHSHGTSSFYWQFPPTITHLAQLLLLIYNLERLETLLHKKIQNTNAFRKAGTGPSDVCNHDAFKITQISCISNEQVNCHLHWPVATSQCTGVSDQGKLLISESHLLHKKMCERLTRAYEDEL